MFLQSGHLRPRGPASQPAALPTPSEPWVMLPAGDAHPSKLPSLFLLPPFGNLAASHSGKSPAGLTSRPRPHFGLRGKRGILLPTIHPGALIAHSWGPVGAASSERALDLLVMEEGSLGDSG